MSIIDIEGEASRFDCKFWSCGLFSDSKQVVHNTTVKTRNSFPFRLVLQLIHFPQRLSSNMATDDRDAQRSLLKTYAKAGRELSEAYMIFSRRHMETLQWLSFKHTSFSTIQEWM